MCQRIHDVPKCKSEIVSILQTVFEPYNELAFKCDFFF